MALMQVQDPLDEDAQVYVKNTFIQIKASDGAKGTSSGSRARLSHKRCVSDPLWTSQDVESVSSPPSAVPSRAMPEAEENSSCSCTFGSSTASLLSRLHMDSEERLAFELSTTASSPPLTHRDDAFPHDAESPELASVEARSIPFRHVRQLSNQTIDSFDGSEEKCESRSYSWQQHSRRMSMQTIDTFDLSPEFQEICKADSIRLGGLPNAETSSPSGESLSTSTATNANSWTPSPDASSRCPPNVPRLPPYSAIPALPYTSPALLGGSAPAMMSCPAPALGLSSMLERSALLSTNPTSSVASHRLNPAEADAILMASYARGVASGLAQSAFAQGFAAGAAVAGASGPFASRSQSRAGKGCSGKQSGAANAHKAESLSGHRQSRQAPCQVFWCDARAFKDAALKDQLEQDIQIPVKCYRTAEMCMRLLRKKQNVQCKMNYRIFLVSWCDAQSLVSFLNDEQFMSKVIVLCDTCGSKGCSKACAWAQQYPQVDVAVTWTQAVQILEQCISNCQGVPSPSK